MKNVTIDEKFMVKFLVTLLQEHSPTGYTNNAMKVVEDALKAFPAVTMEYTRKGALVATWVGELKDQPRAITSHVDTLGGMVKEIKGNGRIKISRLGGLLLNGVETEGCWVITSGGKKVRGSFMFEDSSVHVHGAKVSETKREEANMEIRLDERTTSSEETEALGIQIGDFVCFDPRVEVINGFIRSRFLDDKACVATVIAAMKALADNGLKPKRNVSFHFSNYEEVGHGAAAGIPENVCELLAVDMAAVGTGQNSDEYHASICLKDSGGPYHHGFSNKLRKIAEDQKIDYRTDIYPYYGSDGEAFWRAGGDVAVALIGPGVDASHNYERTHSEALVATAQWVAAYLLSE